ncbi:MAG TPA: hypothetical protein VGL65_04950 [Gemmatimonadales bacterium]|jgi:hypothetical protein
MTAPAAAVVAIAAAVLWVVGFAADPRAAMSAYLVAFMAAATIMIGALLQVMMSHLVGAQWFVVLRRFGLMITAPFPALAVLGVPLLVGAPWLYPWANPSVTVHHGIWLSPQFFAIRGMIYLALWAWIAERLRRWALYQDGASASGIVHATHALRRISVVGLIVVTLTGTLAAFDWTMSLEPDWYSTIYGALVLVGGIVAALAMIAILAFGGSTTTNSWRNTITADHGSALATLLFTFVILWAYFSFSQFLIIWIGDIPVEAAWYRTRATGGWGVLAGVTFAAALAVPFVLFLFRRAKRSRGVLAAAGVWIVAAYLANVFWMIRPATSRVPAVRLIDLVALVAVGAALVAVATVRSRRLATLPVGDPYLDQALRYRRG